MAPRSRSQRDTRGQADAVGTRGRATIRDVAEAAGVSIGTVSRALNERSGVHPATRRRVLDAASSLTYDPDRAARELSNRRPVSVGLSMAHGYRRLTPFFALFLEHLSAHLAMSGLRVDDLPTRGDGLPAGDADAFVLLGAHPDDPRIGHLEKAKRPFVLVGRHPGVRCVAADDEAGGRLAAEHLLRLGHRDVILLTGQPHAQAMADRARGFTKALADAGAAAPTQLVADDGSSLGAYRILRAHLEPGARPTAVFAASDEMAAGCVAAAADLGLRVPADLSVIGFDDLPEIGEGLTTVRQDFEALARETVALLHEALRGDDARSVRLPVTLISRGTTAERR